MNKGLVKVSLLLLSLSASLPAIAGLVGFSGAFAPANWTTTISGTVNGGNNGNVNTTGAPGSITITGGDDPSDTSDSAGSGCTTNPGGPGPAGVAGTCQITYKIGPPALPGDISFNWMYTSNDISPQYDQFGVIVNGVMTELSGDGGPLTQSGSFLVSANTQFGFYVNCTDCEGGAASATISALTVPEPATLALLGFAMAGLGVWRRRTGA